jgi:hypothetical protein
VKRKFYFAAATDPQLIEAMRYSPLFSEVHEDYAANHSALMQFDAANPIGGSTAKVAKFRVDATIYCLSNSPTCPHTIKGT